MNAVGLSIEALKNWRSIIAAVLLFFGFLLMVIFGGFFQMQQDQEQTEIIGGGGGSAAVSPLVRRYEPLVAKYAAKYGVPGYVELLLAKMQQESGGRIPDVLQSSESLGLPRNTITDPEFSIDVGVKYFASVLKKAGGDVKLALQSYNFGEGFINYAKARGGYSKAVAIEFSNMMAAKNGWRRYGDINYVDNVLRYYSGGSPSVPAIGAVNSFGLIKPVETKITSPFGMRLHPTLGYYRMHNGVDFSCNRQTIPIRSVKAGVVSKAGWENPNNHGQGYGQRIYIDHGGGFVTVYAHLSTMNVSAGQKISQGEIIGKCGTTGTSKGLHLHFETHVQGRRVDPAQYLK